MTEAGAVIARFDIEDGELRGTQLTLHAACLVHRGDAYLETLALGAIAAVGVAFERDARRLRWGVIWLVVGLLVFAAAGPLGSLAATAVHEIAAQQSGSASGVAAALLGLFRFLEAVAKVLPFLAVVAALAGAALCGFGWLGTTTLRLTFAGGERAYPVRGRNTVLLDFSERVAEALVALKR